MAEVKKRELTADPVPRKDVELPPLIPSRKEEGVASSGSEEKQPAEANSALAGIDFN